MREAGLAKRIGPGVLSSVLMGAAVLAITLVRFPPEQYAIYPPCPIWSFFHIRCPGCGTTRAYAALLHGHGMEALRLNALTTCALPAFVANRVLSRRRALPGFALPASPGSAFYLCTAFAIIAIFTLLRNL